MAKLHNKYYNEAKVLENKCNSLKNISNVVSSDIGNLEKLIDFSSSDKLMITISTSFSEIKKTNETLEENLETLPAFIRAKADAADALDARIDEMEVE